MIKNIKYSLFCLLFYSCECERLGGISLDIEDSKRKKVFIEQLAVNKTIYINDTLDLYIKEAWIEKMWTHKCQEKIEERESFRGYKYQLCINSNKDLKKYDVEWQIGYDFINSFRQCSKTSLVMDLKESNLDNYCIPVYKGYLQKDSTKNIKIGEFCLKSKVYTPMLSPHPK